MAGKSGRGKRSGVMAAAAAAALAAAAPPPEQVRGGAFELVDAPVEQAGERVPKAFRRVCDLDLHLARGRITRVQHQVASRYAALYERGGYETRTIGSYGMGAGGGANGRVGLLAAGERAVAAREEYGAARAQLPGPLRAKWDAMVVHGESAIEVGRRDGYGDKLAAAFALHDLRTCADTLAGWWGFEVAA